MASFKYRLMFGISIAFDVHHSLLLFGRPSCLAYKGMLSIYGQERNLSSAIYLFFLKKIGR